MEPVYGREDGHGQGHYRVEGLYPQDGAPSPLLPLLAGY